MRKTILIVLSMLFFNLILGFESWAADENNFLSPNICLDQKTLQKGFKHQAFDLASFNVQDLPGIIRLNPGWIEYFVDKKIYAPRFTGILRPAARRNKLEVTPEFLQMRQEFEAINEQNQAPYLHFMELENIHFSVIPWLQKNFPERFDELKMRLSDEDIFWYYTAEFYNLLADTKPFEVEIEGLWWGRPLQEQRISLRGLETKDRIRQIQSIFNLPIEKAHFHAGFIQIQTELSEEISEKIFNVFEKYQHAPFMRFTANDISLAAITNNVLESDKSIVDIPLGRSNIPILRHKGNMYGPSGINSNILSLISGSI